jgi:hypothetical protein
MGHGGTGGTGGTGEGEGEGEGQGTTPCDDCAKDSSIKALSEGQGRGKASAGNGTFDPSVPDAAAIQAQNEFLAAWAQAKSGFAQVFNGSLPQGGGELPVLDYGSIKHVSVVVDLSRHANQFSWVGDVIVFAAIVIAIFAVLG